LVREGAWHPLLTSSVAEKILGGCDRVSLDLGLSEVSLNYSGERVILPDGAVIKLEDLKNVKNREKSVFFSEGDKLYMVAVSNDHFYKLVPTGMAPTVEVDGIRMHRTKGTTPDADADEKMKVLGIKGGRVLDTCTGLGYTAQAALKGGADLIITIELIPEILWIARMNPWSRRIFEDQRVHLLIGDAFDLINTLPSGFFSYIIHDPPRITLAGHLYSQSFYLKMISSLKRGGGLFHYTGEPGSRRRRINLYKGVMQRLRRAGFKEVTYHRNIRGVTCRKPD
jgi:predicted methyltransferase